MWLVTSTATSTWAAAVATPVLTWLYVGQVIPVPVFGMFATITKVVVIPVLLGIALNTLIGEQLEWSKQVCPSLSVGAIVVIIAIVVALNQGALGELAPAVVLVVAITQWDRFTSGLLGCLATWIRGASLPDSGNRGRDAELWIGCYLGNLAPLGGSGPPGCRV